MKNLWLSNDHDKWKTAESRYDLFLENDEKRARDERMSQFSLDELQNMTATEFYNFLHDEFFVWKYTAKNRLATTRKDLEEYSQQENYGDLNSILEELKNLSEFNDIEKCISIVKRIKGLGFAGATALLAVIYPNHFGTCDQFVAKRLIDADAFCNIEKPKTNLKPNALTMKWCIVMEKLMIEKANELNRVNNTEYWTPRKIDKVLFAFGR